MRWRLLIVVVSMLVLPVAPRSQAAGFGDNFADARVFDTVHFLNAFLNTTGYTLEANEPTPSCVDGAEGENFGATLWFAVTPSARTSIFLGTLSSEYDGVLALYTGSALPDLVEVMCNDDVFGIPEARMATILQPGITYYIQLGGFDASVDVGNIIFRAGPRRTTPAVVRGNVWHLNEDYDGVAEFSFAFGKSSDVPLVGAWYGEDGYTVPAVRRGSTWFLNDWFDSGSFVDVGYGKSTDTPVVGDFNGDTFTDFAVVRGNSWLIDTDGDFLANLVIPYGRVTDIPIAGDWDGDGIFSPGVVRGNLWILNNGTDSQGDVQFFYGRSTDVPISGDWDGDGTYTAGVVRAGAWFLSNDSQAPTADLAFGYGKAGDRPLVGDWNGVKALAEFWGF